MSNSLGIDLHDKVVIIKESAMEPEYRELKWRRFYVGGGFGASLKPEGGHVTGFHLEDGAGAFWRGDDVERLATPEEMEEWKDELDALIAEGKSLEDLILEDLERERRQRDM